jgi:hypothetical protein
VQPTGVADVRAAVNFAQEEVEDLIPVKPMSEVEETIKGYYDQYLTGIYNKIKP